MEDKKKELFSQQALDRLRSPEQLDTLLQVTTPVGWMAIIGILLFVVSVLIWSIFGVMAVKVNSVGMIIDSAGVVNITHISGGRVDSIFVRQGERVKKGDVVASLEQPLEKSDAIVSKYNVFSAQNNREVVAHVTDYDSLEYKYNMNRTVVSPYDGIITEVKVNSGDLVSAGGGLFSVRRDQERSDVKATLYVSLTDGKKVQPGMMVQLAPNGVDTSQTGSLIGIVRSVSEYPVSSAGMQRILGNTEVVKWILGQVNQAAMEVQVELVKDERSPSGYLWSSVIGVDAAVTPGSACTGMIVVERKPPIEKVFRKLCQWLRND